MTRALQIESPNSFLSLASEKIIKQMKDLDLPDESKRNRFVLNLIVDEAHYLMTMARVRADEKKALRENVARDLGDDGGVDDE